MMETGDPGANIQVYEDGSLRSALNAVLTADSAKVFSLSYGAGEQVENQFAPGAQQSWDQLAQEANAEGITITVSAGDSGAYEGAQFGVNTPMPSYPASSSYVTTVGATEDAVAPGSHVTQSALWGGNLGAEVPASLLLTFLSAENMMGGGGISTIESRPSYQANLFLSGSGRATPDLSLPGSVVTPGYLAYFGGQLYLFGGTSAGAPLLAGILASGERTAPHGLGNINPALYQGAHTFGAFFPVAYGNNGVYQVSFGYNPATGLGQPNLGRLITLLTQPEGQGFGPGSGRNGR
jgi:kumamolisin